MFYHGSKNLIENQEKLTPQEDSYTNYEECISIENAFEFYRPENKISRQKCVYLVEDPNMIDNVGGYIDYIYLVNPENNYTEKSDLSWYTMASMEMGDFFELEELTEKSIAYIVNYWNSTPSENPCWEYRASQATIINLIEDNSLEKDIEKLFENKKKITSKNKFKI